MSGIEITKPNFNFYLHSSESIPEVEDKSVKMLVCTAFATDTSDDLASYYKSSVDEMNRVVRDDGFVIFEVTDTWKNGSVDFRSQKSLNVFMENGFRLIDIKIWKRQKSNFFIFPFSYFYIFAKSPKLNRTYPQKACKDYQQGVWEYKQQGKNKLLSFPREICDILLDAFMVPGDIILDMAAGTCILPIIASFKGMNGIAYDIDDDIVPEIERTYQEIREEFDEGLDDIFE